MRKLIFCSLFLLSISLQAQWAPANAPLSFTLEPSAFKDDTLVVLDNSYPPNIYLSANAGQNWLNTGHPGFHPSAVFVQHNRLFAYEYEHGVFTWMGDAWVPFNDGLQELSGSYAILSADGSSNRQMVVSSGKIYMLFGNGANEGWVALPENGFNTGFYPLIAQFAGQRIYAYGYKNNGNREVYFSDNNGNEWTQLQVGNITQINAANYKAFSVSQDGSIVLVPGENQLFLHQGNALIPTTGLPEVGYFQQLVRSGDRVYASGLLPHPEGFIQAKVWSSADGGITWALDTQLPEYTYITEQNGLLFAKTENTILLSENNGQSWNPFTIEGFSVNFLRNAKIVSSGNHLLLVGYGDEGVYEFIPKSSQWTPKNQGISRSAAKFLTSFYADGESHYLDGQNGAFYSPDEGQNWVFINRQFRDITKKGNTLFAVDQYSRLFSSTNGTDWTLVNPTIRLYGGLFSWADRLLSSDYAGNVYASDDDGVNWNIISTGVPSFSNMAFSNDKAYGVAFGYQLYESADEGQTWNSIHEFGKHTQSIHWKDGRLFVGFLEGTIDYSDNGTDWFTGQGSPFVRFTPYRSSINEIDGALVAAGYNGIISVSVNNGANWNLFNTGLEPDNYYCASVIKGGDFLYAPCENGLWKRPLSDLTALVATKEPVEGLYQIAPNPGNGIFNILGEKFTGSDLQIQICDMNGKSLNNLILLNGNRSIDLSAYPAGMYLIKISDGEQTGINKIIKQ